MRRVLNSLKKRKRMRMEMSNPKRKTLRPREEELAPKFTVDGTKKEISNPK